MQTQAQRKAAERARKKASGLSKVEVWLPDEIVRAISAHGIVAAECAKVLVQKFGEKP